MDISLRKPICSTCVAETIINNNIEKLKVLFLGGILATDIFWLSSRDLIDDYNVENEIRNVLLTRSRIISSNQCEHVEPYTFIDLDKTSFDHGSFVPLSLINLAVNCDNPEIVKLLLENVRFNLNNSIISCIRFYYSISPEFPGPLGYGDLKLSTISIIKSLIRTNYSEILFSLFEKNLLYLNEAVISKGGYL